MGFVAEARRRNVFRAAVAYLFTGWLSIELGQVMFATLGFGTTPSAVLVIAIAAGLLPLMLCAWLLEVTPEGIRRDDGSGRHAEHHARTARRLDQVSVVVVMLVVAMVATKRFVIPEVVPRTAPQAPAATIAPRSEPAAPRPGLPVEPRSIAVMAFANLGPDPGNDYFGDGVAEELLNVLARVEGLKVASRTSAFSFKGRNVSVREIGRELGVAHVLEGSVRVQGDMVRITAQLIDARTDQHLWSDTYDRRMDDIFQVQEEIATAITTVLRDLLGAQTVSVTRPTADLEAWELFLRARPLYFRRGLDLFTARELLQEAVARDAGFAQASALLAATHYVMPSHFGDIDVAEATRSAREAARKALDIDSRQSIAWAVLSMLAADGGQRDEAAAHMQKALDADANDATAWLWSGIGFVQAGQLVEARKRFEKAVSLDPLVGINNSWLGIVKLMQGEVEDGRALLARARELGSVGDPQWALVQLGVAAGPSPSLAKRLREYLPQDSARPARQQPMWAAVADALADPAKRPQALEAIQAQIAVNPQDRHADALMILGFYHEAIAEEMRVPDGYSDFLARIWYPHDKALREDPLYLELAGQRGLLAYWRAHGFPDACQLVDAAPQHLECKR